MQEATPPPRIPSFRSHPTGVPADAHRPLALVTAGRRGRVSVYIYLFIYIIAADDPAAPLWAGYSG